MPKGDSQTGRWSADTIEGRRNKGFSDTKRDKTIPDHWTRKDYEDYTNYNCERQRSDSSNAKNKFNRGYYLFYEKSRFKDKMHKNNYKKASELAKQATPSAVWEATSNDVGSPSSPARETQVEVGGSSSPARETQVQSFPEEWSSTHDEQAQEAVYAYNRYHGYQPSRERHWADEL